MDNAEDYVELMFDFCMHTGIQKQMEAFRGMIRLAILSCLALYLRYTQCVSKHTKTVCVTWLFKYKNIMSDTHYYIIHVSYKYGAFFDTEGFNRVFPMEKLSSFSHKEVQMILCGNQSPSWTSEDIVNYTEPKLGYTRDR